MDRSPLISPRTFAPEVASVVIPRERIDVRLGELARVNPRAQVILRADRRLRYGAVREVMEIVAGQKLTRLQVVAELGEN